MSTGMATLGEIDEAGWAFRDAGGVELALLACTCSYPAPPEEMHLRRIPHLAGTFDVVPGLSDHTLGIEVPVAATAFGAQFIEKHLILSREEEGPDSEFSLLPNEFRKMVDTAQKTESAVGEVSYDIGEKEDDSKSFRPSLFVLGDIKEGEGFSRRNIRSIPSDNGVRPKHKENNLGLKDTKDIKR